MDWMEVLVTFLTCAFEIFIFYDYFRNFFELRVSGKIAAMICGIAIVALFAVNMLQSSVTNLVLIPVLLWIFVMILFEAGIWVKLGYFVFSYAVMVGVEFLYVVLTDTTSEAMAERGLVLTADHVWQLILVKFINYVVFLLLKRFSPKKRRIMVDRLFFLYLCAPISMIGHILFRN